MSAIITEQGDYIDNITRIPAPTGTNLVIYTADGSTTTYAYANKLLASMAHERLKSALINQVPVPLYSDVPAPTITGVLGPLATAYCAVGAPVTVNGTNFVPNTRAFFGTAECAVTFISGPQLNVVAPPNALGAKDVSVVRPDGGSAASSAAITYLVAIITSISPSAFNISTATVTVNGYGFAASQAGVICVEDNPGNGLDSDGYSMTPTYVSATKLTAVFKSAGNGIISGTNNFFYYQDSSGNKSNSVLTGAVTHN